MAPAAKRPSGKQPGAGSKNGAAAGVGAAALMAAANAAVGALSDPKVRQQLIDFGSGLTDSVRARSEARRAAQSADAPGPDPGPRSHALRQRRLEHRADKLSENLELLRLSPGAESAAALTSVAEVVGRVRLALAVTNNLPLRRRVAAQRDIAGVLAELENAVLRATMPDGEAINSYSTDPIDGPA